VGKAREIVGGPIVATITGADASAAADTAHKAFQEFLDSEKK
jgi:multiple sugar transport system substrate-binding protein